MGRRGSNRVRLRSDGGLGTGEVGSGGDLEPAKVRGVACPSPGFLRCREHGEAPGRACPLLGPGSHRNVELEERSQGRRKRKELDEEGLGFTPKNKGQLMKTSLPLPVSSFWVENAAATREKPRGSHRLAR